MDKEILTYVDVGGVPLLAGRLWTRARGGRQNATFEYDRAWLEYKDRFSLEPVLEAGPGPFHTGGDRPLFGAIGDSAPDRWGRVLMRRAERRRAEQAGETPRTLMERDHLLMVSDEARQGALRFSTTEGGPFLAPGQDGIPIPPLVDLPKLLSAADRIAGDSDDDEDLRLLLAPGSSLGGTRPKASVRDRDGSLMIAKFPHRNDEIDLVRWEAAALTMAARAGIMVPDWRLEIILDKPVLLLRRFDRTDGVRVPFLSAMSMLGATDNETHSYLEFVDALRQYGAAPQADMHALWRRIVFSIMISNTDDHLRNHGFLYQDADGWRLAPAYDMNPVPVDIKPRVLSTAIDLDSGEASVELALSVAEYFELDREEATGIISQVGAAVSGWREVAPGLGIGREETGRMESAFEHSDL
jgi:serine/threonine-protein kinase HipA